MTTRGRMSRRAALLATGIVALAGCAGAEEQDAPAQGGSDGSDVGGHEHAADSGPPPEGIAEATDPTDPVGTEAVLAADHIPGMDGATATLDSATDETVYMVDIVMDGMEMTDHKWVVESEIRPAD